MMTNNEKKAILSNKDLNQVGIRWFMSIETFNYETQLAGSYAFAVMPALRKIYKDDSELTEAMDNHFKYFNCMPWLTNLILGATLALEDNQGIQAKDAVQDLKVSLMGPLSGIGDTFFWGIIRILACALAIGFAKEGNPIAPFILLLVFNIPNVLTRLITLDLGYNKGAQILSEMEKTGRMALFTHCAGIIGAMSIGCMIAMWVSINCPLQFTLSGSEIIIQDYLDQIMPKLLPLACTLGVYGAIKKKVKVQYVIAGIVVIGFVLGILGLISA